MKKTRIGKLLTAASLSLTAFGSAGAEQIYQMVCRGGGDMQILYDSLRDPPRVQVWFERAPRQPA